jgi:hypothetical protein
MRAASRLEGWRYGFPIRTVKIEQLVTSRFG